MNSKIGIILVNYNGLEDTIECINSISKSTYQNYFIIIVDNNSTQECSCLAKYNNVTLIMLKENVGFGIANNIGASIAKREGADYILCLNNDTIIKDDMLSILVCEADDRTIVVPNIYYYNSDNKIWYAGGTVSRLTGTFRHRKFKKNREITFACGCCILIPLKCIDEIGLFDDSFFMYYEDADFSLRAKKAGYKLYFIYNAILFHKVGQSINRTPGLKDYYLTRNRLYLLNKHKDFFSKFAFIYFFLTRFIVIVLKKIHLVDTEVYFDGLRDFKEGRMGKRIT